MAAGALFALTLPGLVVLLVALGAAETLWARLGRPSPVFRRERRALSAGGLDVFSAALAPGRAVDLEQQRAREILRDDVEDGAPPYDRIDLDGGVAHLDVPRRSHVVAGPDVTDYAGRPTNWQPSGHLGDTAAP